MLHPIDGTDIKKELSSDNKTVSWYCFSPTYLKEIMKVKAGN